MFNISKNTITNIIKLIINNKLLIKYLILIFVLSITNIILFNIKNNNEIELMQINYKYNRIKQLSNDEFVLKHKFINNANNVGNFLKYVEKYLKNNHCEIIDIKNTNSTKMNDIKIETIEFNLTFPHDKFIFELIDLIQEYNPGFVRIQNIFITKDKLFNINKNNLKVKILCELYTK